MESLKIAELIAAAFELKRSVLQFKLTQLDCTIANLQLHQADQTKQLSITQYQQAQITLALIIS